MTSCSPSGPPVAEGQCIQYHLSCFLHFSMPIIHSRCSCLDYDTYQSPSQPFGYHLGSGWNFGRSFCFCVCVCFSIRSPRSRSTCAFPSFRHVSFRTHDTGIFKIGQDMTLHAEESYPSSLQFDVLPPRSSTASVARAPCLPQPIHLLCGRCSTVCEGSGSFTTYTSYDYRLRRGRDPRPDRVGGERS